MNFNVTKHVAGLAPSVIYLLLFSITTLIVLLFYRSYTKPLLDLLESKKNHHRQLSQDYHTMLKSYATSAAYYKAHGIHSKPITCDEMVQDLVVACESCGLEIVSYNAGSSKPGSQPHKQKINLKVTGKREHLCTLIKVLEDKPHTLVEKITIDAMQDSLCAADMSIALRA
ncbi:hypothetical protein Noda2021_00720 [Candidatus Dependentiae bacterium Noda2021]|nr:hypothetical protein Noda2021_00720 [Candidatus Dependentiae bacterium Noda2021]